MMTKTITTSSYVQWDWRARSGTSYTAFPFTRSALTLLVKYRNDVDHVSQVCS